MQRARTRNRRHRSGFTLVEVLLVLVILGVIAAMVVPNLLSSQQTANIKATRASIHGFETALKLYAVSNNSEFPQVSSDEMVNLMLNPGQDASGRPLSPYLERPPKDAWGQPLIYEYPNSKVANATMPAIWSIGLNHQNEDGAGDDINNWSELMQ